MLLPKERYNIVVGNISFQSSSTFFVYKLFFNGKRNHGVFGIEVVEQLVNMKRRTV